MPIEVKLTIENEKEFISAIQRAKAMVGDLTIPLTSIAKHWFKGNKAIFSLTTKGKYEDLSPAYKKRKTFILGTPYPILRLSGDLEASITEPTDSKAVSQIINKDTLVLGTKVSYASFHQTGTRRMPRRPVVFVGPEEPYVSNADQQNRPKIWLEILNNFVLQKAKQELDK